ncbi:hypothetical protein BDF22DRAFT_689902 [Syncephalis plumigaleata]|nr:hypothetical protein BDF22DRAFT_689902 [Syncephalis plumigaleata]
MSTPQADKLFTMVAGVDKRLRQLSKAISDPLDEDLMELRTKLRDIVEQLLLTDIVLAQRKSIENIMWRRAFYQPIEEYRRILKKFPSSETIWKSPGYREAWHGLQAFLYNASNYFTFLLKRLIERYELTDLMIEDGHMIANCILGETQFLTITSSSSYSPIPETIRQRAYQTVYRCYVYLGDLARYSELHTNRKQKRWAAAADLYRKALRAYPVDGNAYNQLAVLSTYINDELSGVYYYYCSMSTSQPFPTANENIGLLLRHVRKHTFTSDRKLATRSTSNATTSQATALLSDDQIKSMLRIFLSLHAAIYYRDSMTPFESVQSQFFTLFEMGCQTRQLSGESLMRMLVINLCAHYQIRRADTSSNVSSTKSSTRSGTRSSRKSSSEKSHGIQEERHRESIELFILKFTLNMITIMLRVVVGQLALDVSTNTTATPESVPFLSDTINTLTDRVPVSVRRLLPCLRISVNWLRTTFDRIPLSVIAQRAVTLKTLADMLNALVALGVDPTLETPEDTILAEDILIRGAAYLTPDPNANVHAYSDESLALASSVVHLDVYMRMIRLLREGKHMADKDQGFGYTEYPNARIVFYGERPRTGAPNFTANATWPAVFPSSASSEGMKTASHSVNSASEDSGEIILFQGHHHHAPPATVQHTIRRPDASHHRKKNSSTRGSIINGSHQTGSSTGSSTTWNHFDAPRLVDFQALFGQNSSTPPSASNKYDYPHVNNNSNNGNGNDNNNGQEDKSHHHHNGSQPRISLPTSDTLFSWTPGYNQLWTQQHHESANTSDHSPTWNAVATQGAEPLTHMSPTSMANQESPPMTSHSLGHGTNNLWPNF